jgi:hypothetical protein
MKTPPFDLGTTVAAGAAMPSGQQVRSAVSCRLKKHSRKNNDAFIPKQ